MPAPRFDSFQPSSPHSSRTKKLTPRAGTRPELHLRRALWRAGCRYRTNFPGLPGRPDIVFTRARVVVFCDGDFWHGRNWEERLAKLRSGANSDYWIAKITANMQRDIRTTAQLEALGWRVLRYWEGNIIATVAEVVADIKRHLSQKG